MASEKQLKVSLISGNHDLKETLSTLISDSLSNVMVTEWHFESGFIESSTVDFPDVIISDRTEVTTGWKIFLDKLTGIIPEALLIFIISDQQKELPVEMIRSGVYDVITPSSLLRIKPLLNRVVRDMNDRITLLSLAKDKYFNDHINNTSRSA
jgi:hypothetical protein